MKIKVEKKVIFVWADVKRLLCAHANLPRKAQDSGQMDYVATNHSLVIEWTEEENTGAPIQRDPVPDVVASPDK